MPLGRIKHPLYEQRVSTQEITEGLPALQKAYWHFRFHCRDPILLCPSVVVGHPCELHCHQIPPILHSSSHWPKRQSLQTHQVPFDETGC